MVTSISHFHHHHHHPLSPPPTFYNVGDGSTTRFDRHRLHPLPRHHPNGANRDRPRTANEGRRPCHARWHGHWEMVSCPTTPSPSRPITHVSTAPAQMTPTRIHARSSANEGEHPCHVCWHGHWEMVSCPCPHPHLDRSPTSPEHLPERCQRGSVHQVSERGPVPMPRTVAWAL